METADEYVSMSLYQIVINENQPEQFIIIQEEQGPRKLPIMIGIFEANAINMKVKGILPPRPFTHDLLAQTIESLGAKLEKIVIDKIMDQTFHAKLHLIDRNGERVLLDSRPSDAIALAVRTECRMEAAESVLKTSAIDIP